MPATMKRHPVVANRRLALDLELKDTQFQRGLYVVDRGERFAVPADHVTRKTEWRGRDLWRWDAQHGTHRAGVQFEPRRTQWQSKTLAWLRDRVHQDIPSIYYHLVLGHDLHVSTWGELYGKHWHAGWADPITGEVQPALDPTFETLFATHYIDHECDLPVCPRDAGVTLGMLRSVGGFVENLGLLSKGKVTTAFVSEEIDELVSTTGTEYADFDFHEVGTSSAAEANTQTALTTTSGIARATGTPTDSDPVYDNAGTITADATETWEEHGLFNNSTGAAMMDRSLTGGQSVNSSDQVTYTYSLTKNAEA